MKTLFSLAAILIFSISAHSQSDTLYTKKQQKIVCKIIEVNEFDFKYQLGGMQEGPMYVINRDKVLKYTLSNGFTEIIIPDELLVDGEHNEILGNRTVIKIHPFSLVNNQISVAYEKVIKVGMNLDVEVGYINNSMNQNPIFSGSQVFYSASSGPYYNASPAFYSGAYIKPGIKFFLGRDYSTKGLKYAHPLKGRYLRFELALSYLNYQNVSRVDYYYPNPQTSTITTDVSAISYGGFINYGRQFILGNLFTFEYYIGLGFTGLSYSYSNPEYLNASNPQWGWYGYPDQASQLSNFHGFQRIPGVGLSGTMGLRVGYILPDKSKQTKKHAPIN